ncbi:MAG: VCBS repeat-containing protein [Planctomycetes bacterium]|nr:VCBS repeat-containing protein [Planctomycetota bacterium]
MLRRATTGFPGLLGLLAVLAAACDGGGPRGARERARAIGDPHRLRVLGKLHAELDTRTGCSDAAAYLRRLVELEPGSASDRIRLASALLFAEDVAGCERELAEARGLLAGAEAPPELEYLSGLAAKRRGAPREALEAFARVTERKPRHLHAWFQRGTAEEHADEPEHARRSLERALEVKPDFSPAAYRLAMVLQRLGRAEESKEMLERFRSMPDPGAFEAERCDLTQASLRPLDGRPGEPPPAKVSFVAATERFLGKDAGRGMLRARPLRLGAEGAPGLVLAGPGGARVVRLGPGGPAPASPELAGGAAGSAGGIADAVAADLDSDGSDDAVLAGAGGLRAFRGMAEGSFQPETAPLLEGEVPGALACDADHDGDLDLAALAASPRGLEVALLRSNGDRTFARLAPFGAMAARFESGEASSGALSAHDLDQANDLDLVAAGGEEGVQAFLNRRDGTFARVALRELGKRTLVLAEDLDSDGAPDLFAAGGEPGWTWARNANRLGSPQELRLEAPSAAPGPDPEQVLDACAADIDNDGDLDVLLASGRRLFLLRNAAGGLLEAQDVPCPGAGARAVGAADLDADGVLEVLVGSGEGVEVLAAELEPGYGSLRLALEGKRDSPDGIGAVVEAFAGRLYQSLIVREPAGLHIGLGPGGREALDGLRLRWPQGIVQPVLGEDLVVQPGRRGEVLVVQKEGLVASCPFLYARTRGGWRFLTDVLGIAPLDEWLPPGQDPRQNSAHGARLDPEEWVRVDGDAVEPVDGALRFAITEELRETAYIDRLELVAVDHPEDVEVYADESSPQRDRGPLRLQVLPRRGLRPPAAARLDDGADVLGAVRARDGAYAHAYRPSRPQHAGWCERSGLELEAPGPASALLLTGRVAWYDATVAYSLWQGGRTWGPVRLERLAGDGSWVPVAEDLGLPSGMDRTMVVPLATTNVVDTRARLRLSGQHRLLWDRILFAGEGGPVEVQGPEGELRLAGGCVLAHRTLPLRGATLGCRGFSRVLGDPARHEQTYRYEDAAPGDAFAPAEGLATRHGDVTPLLRDHDDLLAVLVAGDGVEVDFEPPPSLPPGRRRTFFLRVSGWAKESSFHNRTGREIAPLPFRAMSRYPPPAGEGRRDEAYRAYLEAYQTRIVGRRAP